MAKSIKRMVIGAVSNTLTLQAMLETATWVHITAGLPIPEKYPPSVVLVPQRKFPYLKPMKGIDYYEQLKARRKLRGKI